MFFLQLHIFYCYIQIKVFIQLVKLFTILYYNVIIECIESILIPSSGKLEDTPSHNGLCLQKADINSFPVQQTLEKLPVIKKVRINGILHD